MSLAYRIQHNLKQLMQQHRGVDGKPISEKALGEGAGVVPSTINRMLRGETQKTEWATLDAIARYLQIDPQRFFAPLELPLAANEKEVRELMQVSEHLPPHMVRSITEVAKSLQTAQAEALQGTEQAQTHLRSRAQPTVASSATTGRSQRQL